MRSVICAVICAVLLVLGGCASKTTETIAPEKGANPPRFDVTSVKPDPFVLGIRTNIRLEGVGYRESNSSDDRNCEKARSFKTVTLDPDRTNTSPLIFSRQGSPSRALYEWHICLVIDGVTYRAWRGFDPGPGTELEVSCFVDEAQIRQRDTTRYLCGTQRVTQNPGNHAEYAFQCWTEDSCKGFDTKTDYEGWVALNPLSREEVLEIVKAVLDDQLSKNSYISANPMDYYLDIDGEDPPPDFLERFSSGQTSFHPASDFDSHEGLRMRMSIGAFERTEKGLAEGRFSTYCGPECASWHSVIVEKVEGIWRVKAVELNAIS